MTTPSQPPRSLGRARWHRTYKLRHVAAGLGAGALAVGVAGAISPAVAAVLAVLLYVGTLVSAIMIGTGMLKPKPMDGEVVVRDGAVLLNGREIVASGTANNGAVASSARGGQSGSPFQYIVRLGRQGDMFPRCVLEFDTKTRADELLAALSLDPSHRTFGVSTLSGIGYGKSTLLASFAPLVLGLVLMPFLVRVSHLLGAGVAGFGYLWWLYSFLGTRTRTVIGTDGVLVKWLAMRRFCAWSEVRDVEYTENGVRLVKSDGTNFDLNLNRVRTQNQNAPALAAMLQTREELYERCDQMLKAHRNRTLALDPATLAREDRDARSWVGAVRGVLAGMKGMRSADVPRDAFWSLLLDGGADEEARAGAIAAISADASDDERSRLRAAADTVASPRLRVVLEAAADGNDEKLTDAMDGVRVARRGR